MNSYAWFLLTCEIPDLRDEKEALEYALQANELTDFMHPSKLDTLALAYHRSGQTEKAIASQERALELLPSEAAHRSDYEERLAEYKAAIEVRPPPESERAGEP